MYELYKRPVKKKTESEIIDEYRGLIQKTSDSQLLKDEQIDLKLLFIAILREQKKPDIIFKR